MTAKAPATEMTIRRAIAAARKAGLYVLAIRPDGTVVVGERPINSADVVPAAPRSAEEAERAIWENVKP
jgi:hypothetical protein